MPNTPTTSKCVAPGVDSQATIASDFPWARHAPLLVVIVLYGWLAVTGAFVDPLFMKPDEPYHFAHFTYLKLNSSLPTVDLAKSPGSHTAVEQEAHQPPLYYALTWLGSALSPPPVESFAQWNPHLRATEIGNRSPRAPSYLPDPLQSPLASLLVGRLVSVAFGALAIVSGYALLHPLLGALTSASALALMAFNPQFIFITSSFSNDAIEIGAATLALLLLSRLYHQPRSLLRGVAAGLALGGALLAKLTGLGLVAVVVLLSLACLRRERRLSVLAPWGAALVVALVTSGWWFWRNWQIYRDPLALNVLPSILGRRESGPSGDEWIGFLGFTWKSYWFDLGIGATDFTSDAVYWGLAALAAVALTGTILAFARYPRWQLPLAVLSVWFAAVLVPFLSLANRAATIMGGGRLLFPAAIAVAGLTAIGLDYFSSRFRLPVLHVCALCFFAFAVYAQFGYTQPANPRPAFLNDAAAVSPSWSLDARFDDGLSLLGVDTKVEGDIAYVKYFWRTRARPGKDYSVFLQQVIQRPDGNNSVVSQIDTFPGYGATRTRLWRPGDIVVDTLSLTVKPVNQIAGDSRLLLVPGLYDSRSMKRLPVTAADDPQAVLYGDTLVLTELLGR